MRVVSRKYPELNISDRILLSAGPTNVNPRVYKAMNTAVIGYGQAAFFPVIEGISSMLAEVFQTEKNFTMALSATGSAGVEAGMSNLIKPGDTVIIGSYGFFCERMADMARRQGANVVLVDGEWGRALPPEQIQDEIKKHKNIKLVGMVHAETSTGISQPLEDISRIAKEHDALLVVDGVTSLGGSEILVDEWGIDYISSASQKCLGCPPGLSPVSVSELAFQTIDRVEKDISSWYFDLRLIADYWGPDRSYHHTVPASMLYALYEGLRIVLEEGVENRFARHQDNAAGLRAGLEALGLNVISDEQNRLAQITPIAVPYGVDEGKVRQHLVNEYNTEISQGLGRFAGKVWRVGLMGESSTRANVLHLLSALEHILPQEGYEVAVGAGVSAASKFWSAG